MMQRFHFPMIVALAFLAALVAAGGCSKNLRHIQNQEEFDEYVLLAEKPVLVEFYKGGCPTCLTLEPSLDKLADEYRGKVEFVRFELMTPIFVVTSQEMKETYEVSVFPTVLLFVDGNVRARWVMNYDLDTYRPILDQFTREKEKSPALERVP